MVNLVAAQKPLLHGLMKLAGLRPHTVEIEPGTSMNFWVPSETLNKKSDEGVNDQSEKEKKKKKKNKNKAQKPVVVLVHGFAAEGIVTWQFQVGALTGKYNVYVPDLLFFGGSITNSDDRSPTFQAECLVKGLKKLGVERCTVVGFSYGGMVAFKIAELHPHLVQSLVVSGSVLAMTDSISDSTLERLGFSSSSELLLPTSVKGLKALLSVAAYKKLWFPHRLYKDYLEVMFTNRKERSELLEALVSSNKDITTVPNFSQSIHLLWGENDQIFNLELAKALKEKLGNKASLHSIKKAGHLVHLERPCAYNRHLKRILASVQADGDK
ncbi:PREDICTED: epoxide hydrolase 4 [Nelumbo nucifera]|uniref:Epoxide hydrolase 4 n=1 Tax=Nelumbo nucifera TaxID=4432 RepID=A0A1U8AMK1_NELNU|nr:PREDICTED: epoxide hydrolase 4 [Nelumbo nucifera]